MNERDWMMLLAFGAWALSVAAAFAAGQNYEREERKLARKRLMDGLLRPDAEL